MVGDRFCLSLLKIAKPATGAGNVAVLYREFKPNSVEMLWKKRECSAREQKRAVNQCQMRQRLRRDDGIVFDITTNNSKTEPSFHQGRSVVDIVSGATRIR